MRCFIAIDFPEVIKEKIAEIQTLLSKAGADVTWVNPAHIHLTLYFFKELPVGKVELLYEKIKKEIQEQEAFELTLHGIGSFPPSPDDPRVIWIGIQGSLKLAGLYQKIQGVSQPFDEKRPKGERNGSFTPHATVGRVRSRKNLRPVKNLIEKFSSEPVGICPVDELIFFESRLSQKGPDYFKLHRIPLKHQHHI